MHRFALSSSADMQVAMVQPHEADAPLPHSPSSSSLFPLPISSSSLFPLPLSFSSLFPLPISPSSSSLFLPQSFDVSSSSVKPQNTKKRKTNNFGFFSDSQHSAVSQASVVRRTHKQQKQE